MLTFDPNAAKQADQFNAAITQSGKYICTITRAEKLTAKTGTAGLGLSVKLDTGETAQYLDIYIAKSNGEPLSGMKTVQAIIGCLSMRSAPDGQITVEKYNPDTRTREQKSVPGYPEMMGKRIGLLLQQELSTYNGKEQSKMVIVGVFQADTGLTVTEILDRKTKPETLGKMMEWLIAHPVNDRRSNAGSKPAATSNSDAEYFDQAGRFDDQEIPF